MPSVAWLSPAVRTPGSQPSPTRPGSWRRLKHAPALDGLRGLAIAAVVLFHFPTRVAFPGGLFGVDVFFALSGFLITALLLGEFSRNGRIALGLFARRRVRRLLPALVVFLGVWLGLDLLVGQHRWFGANPFSGTGHPVPARLAIRGVAGVLTYSLNDLRAAHVALPPITHLWSLSLEGQFYLMWVPLLVWLLCCHRRAALPVTVALTVASVVMPFLQWADGAGSAAVYFGTPSRLQGLLIGAIGAQLWARGSLDHLPRWSRRLAALAGAGVLAWEVLAVGNVPFRYLGGETVAALAATAIITLYADHAQQPADPAGRLLSIGPLRWLGERSYALYLWHYPVDSWTTLLPHVIGVPIGIGGSLLLAALSWRLVEQPVQRRARRRAQARTSREPDPVGSN